MTALSTDPGYSTSTDQKGVGGGLTTLQQLMAKKDQMAVVEQLETWYKECKEARIHYERQWYLNMAFYKGKQWLEWQKALGDSWQRLWEPPCPEWRVRLTINKIKPIVRSEISKLIKEDPSAFVIPATTQDTDRVAAEAADKIFDFLRRKLELKLEIIRAVFWLVLFGNGFIKDYWDPGKLDFDGQPGSIGLAPLSPFAIFAPQLQEEELENQPYLIQAGAKTTAWVEGVYHRKLAGETLTSKGLLEQRFQVGLAGSPTRIVDAKKDSIVLKEAWIKPCLKYPEGAVFVWAQDQLLWGSVNESGEFSWPYIHKQYPYTKLDHIPSGEFYSDSVVTDLIPLQKEYNKTRSQILEAKNRMAKPQWVAPRGSVDVDMVTSEPGLVVEYEPGFAAPEQANLKPLPGYVIQELDRILRDMDDISSQHEVTKGRTPPGVTAATAISYLQEEDDSKLATTIHSIERGVEKIGRHMLCHVQQFWAVPRTVQVLGDADFEAYEFSQTDVSGNTDLYVEPGSGAPRSRAAKQALILQLMDSGSIPKEVGLRYLQMSETARMYEDTQIDRRQAQRENLKMMQGSPISLDPQNPFGPHDWDNHLEHSVEHGNYMKREVFERLDPQKQKVFFQHYELHKMRVIAEMQQMSQPGGPPEAGGGPGPGRPPNVGNEPVTTVPGQ